MATYAIGDLQGCLDALHRLLERCAWDPARDTLWFVGDLVNRGTQSVEILRFVKSLGDRAVVTLGNHDLHLLVVAAGHRKAHRGDTLEPILAAPDRDELLGWLRHRKLMHFDHGIAMVHAGLLPQWSIPQALALAREAETALQAPDHDTFLAHMYGNEPTHWADDLRGHDRLRVIVNAMTRLRICTAEGGMEFSHKGEPKNFPAGYLPWFDVPTRASRGTPIVCGHWSALGLITRPDFYAIDTGCLWGRALTALRIEDRQVFQISCEKIAD
jgi:bis(5'-nucleosyl)-tetraphosphatase (symmetrical)